MENPLEFGMQGLLIDIGAGLSTKYLFEPLRQRDVNAAVGRNANLRARLQNTAYGPETSFSQRLKQDIKNRNRLQRLRPKLKDTVGRINSKYSRLKFGARAIGWGYLALGAATAAEALTTPGLSTSAEMNNAQTMGMTPPLDSSQAYTQRQRALMAIHDSQLGIRNVIGGEAGFLHR